MVHARRGSTRIEKELSFREEETRRRAWQHFEPELAEQGYELVEIEYVQGPGGAHVLRIFVDKADGGITLDDCSAVAQLLGPMLDAGSFVDGKYLLEVSSPGFDRPLRKASDFERFAGEEVKLATRAPVAGRKRYRGVLQGMRDGLILLECDGAPHEIHIENLRKANLVR